MEIWYTILLLVAGLLSGFMNVLAGGGSLLVMPIMTLFLDMPGPLANGTNRVAILAQNVSAVAGFRKKGFSDIRLSISLAMCALPGAAIGAWYGTKLDGEMFNRVLAGVMVMVMLLMALKQRQSKRKKAQPEGTPQTVHIPTRKQLIAGHILIVAAGFYGGFIQAGVGFILMAILHQVMGLDLVRVNMHKVFIVAAYTVLAVGVFAYSGNILWTRGLILAGAMAVGGWFGSHFAVDKGEGFIRIALNVALTVLIVKLLI
jgi:uncharacterized protein